MAFPLDVSYRGELIQMDEAFRQKIVAALPNDPALRRIYKDIMDRAQKDIDNGDAPTTTRETFRIDLDSGLMYQMAPNGRERLCIPTELHVDIMRIAHDNMAHQGRLQTCERIRQSMYVPHLRKLVDAYVGSCPVCKVCRLMGGLPAGQLQPISPPMLLFHTLTLDFIVGLPRTPNGNDCALTVTEKAGKAVRIIPGQIDADAFNWAIKFFDYVVSQWGMPKCIILDRDGRFLSKFWQALWKRVGTTLAMTTAYHPPANGQSERTNQVVEVALRCMIANHDGTQFGWDEMCPDLELVINTSRHSSTGELPFEYMYGVHPRTACNLHEPTPEPNESAEHFLRSRMDIRQQAEDSFRMAQAKMAIYYDQKHSAVRIGDLAYVKLTTKLGKGYRIPYASTLDVIKVGPFKVIEKVGKLAFRLELPPHMKIHPVISVVHLEPAVPDPYNRPAIGAPVITETARDGNGDEENTQPQETADASVEDPTQQRYAVNRILDKQLRKHPGDRTRKWHYKVRWLGEGHSEDS